MWYHFSGGGSATSTLYSETLMAGRSTFEFSLSLGLVHRHFVLADTTTSTMRGLPMFAVAGLQSVVGLSPWGRRVKCWSSRPVSESAQQTAAFLANPDGCASLSLANRMSHVRQVSVK